MRNLEHVPYALPHVVEKLDLSSNVIKKLEQGDFSSCRNLKELILDNNPLGSVDFTVRDFYILYLLFKLVFVSYLIFNFIHHNHHVWN